MYNKFKPVYRFLVVSSSHQENKIVKWLIKSPNLISSLRMICKLFTGIMCANNKNS